MVAPALISSADISHCCLFNDAVKGFFLCRNERWQGLNPVDKISLTLSICPPFTDLINSSRIFTEHNGVFVINRRSIGHRRFFFAQGFIHSWWNSWPHGSLVKTFCFWTRAKALEPLKVREDSVVEGRFFSSWQIAQILSLIFSTSLWLLLLNKVHY